MDDKVFQRLGVVVLLVATGLGVSAGQDKPAAVTSAPEPTGEAVNSPGGKDLGAPPLQRRNPRYQIGRGDLLELSFPLVAEFNQTVTVQPDGFVTLRGVGDVHVVGQTVPELTLTLKTAYSKILHDPLISVDLKDFEKPYFVAMGEVGKPGKYDLRGDTTVTQGVAIAGGFRDGAKRTQVLLFRRVSNEWTEVKKINLKEMLQAKNLSEDLQLVPGDLLFVPKSVVGKIARYIPNSSVGTMVPILRPY